MMEFRIAVTFTDSLAKLTGEEQKAVKTTAFDLQLNPASPGMQFHKLERAKDKGFWSVRVNSDIRLIVHRTEAYLLLCYVDHHDKAYRWAERRVLETHPKTGAAQLVELRETVKEITIPKYVATEEPTLLKPPLYAHVSRDELLSYGVPTAWLDAVYEATEDTVLDLVEHLPGEAAEALLDLATGVSPNIAQPAPTCTDPFAHPDAQRRFRVMNNIEELERALEFPWEKWTVFLHPTQRQLVEREYGGPARVSGSAGTGKTIVALHRAVFLARANPDARVLLTTFSDALASILRTKLMRLISSEPRLGERLEVRSMNVLGRRLFELNFGRPLIAPKEMVLRLLTDAAEAEDAHGYGSHFLMAEWQDVVDAWQLETWEDYRDVARLGRKTRLPEKHRVRLWPVFSRVRSSLRDQNLVTLSGLFTRLADWLASSNRPPFDYVVVDEAQDVSVAQLRFLAALGTVRSDSLFFAGDLGQRIFQQPFSWRALGVDVRGRSKTLRICYRTTHQIRVQADRLLEPQLSDVDGNTEGRRGTISVFNGPAPSIRVLESVEAEIAMVSQWLGDRTGEGIAPQEIGVFVRSPAQIARACEAVEEAGFTFGMLDEHTEPTFGHVSVGTMHLAKGLEFRAVVVMACDGHAIPLQERMEAISDEADLEEVYNTERHLLYVACTRARDHLLVTGVAPASEFLDDLRV